MDPFSLLGVTPNSTIEECRKNYYSLALICHPDKGGNPNDMLVLHNSYKYVLEQLEFTKKHQKTILEIEQSFHEYMKTNQEKAPSYYDIWMNSDEAKKMRKFNEQFENMKRISLNQNSNPFDYGYGDLMVQSEEPCDNKTITQEFICQCFKSVMSPNAISLVNSYLFENPKPFITETSITKYIEPKTKLSINYGKYHRFDTDTVDDFTCEMGCDYKLAFSSSSNKSNPILKKN